MESGTGAAHDRVAARALKVGGMRKNEACLPDENDLAVGDVEETSELTGKEVGGVDRDAVNATVLDKARKDVGRPELRR